MDKLILTHNCTLKGEDDIICRYISNGWFVETRRKIRSLFIVSERNPKSREFLKSRASIQYEKSRHLQYYYFMIHPFSVGRAYWEFFMMFVFFCLLIIIPFETTTSGLFWVSRVPKFIFDILCCVDIVITFVTGYYQRDTKKIILDTKRVAKNYIFGYFLIDCMSSIPIDMFIYFMGIEEMFFVKFIIYAKVLRVTTFFKYLDSYRDWRQYNILKFKMVKLITAYLLLLLWTTSFVYNISLKTDNSWLTDEAKRKSSLGLVMSCFKSASMLFLVGHGGRASSTELVLLFEIICTTIGYILYVYILAQILQAVVKYSSSQKKYTQLVGQLYEYMRYKELPETLKKRIYRYFDFKYQKRYFKSNEIFDTLSTHMKQEIVLHSLKRMVEKVDFFKNLPASLLVRIVTCLTSEIYLPNDVILHSGVTGDAMFFISSGTVAVYTTLGRELCHLSDGEHFGEIALVMDEQRTASVVAVSNCELYSLSRNDFQSAIEPYPDLLYRMRQLAHIRMQQTVQQIINKTEDAKESLEKPK